MLRKRDLSGVAGRLELNTFYFPDPSSDDLSEELCSVKINFSSSDLKDSFSFIKGDDNSRLLSVSQNYRLDKATPEGEDSEKYPYPPLYLIAEEIDFLLNLVKQL